MNKPKKFHVMENIINTDDVISNRELSRKIRNETIDEYDAWILGELRSLIHYRRKPIPQFEIEELIQKLEEI